MQAALADYSGSCIDAVRLCSERYPADFVYWAIVVALMIGFLLAWAPLQIRKHTEKKND